MAKATAILSTLNHRRRELGMPYRELSRRSGVPISTIKRILAGKETAGLSAVAALAEALGVSLAAVEKENASAMRARQAREKARSLVALVQGTSALEAQAVEATDVELMEERTAAELLSGSSIRLWER